MEERNYELEYEMKQLRQRLPREYLARFCPHNGEKFYEPTRSPITPAKVIALSDNQSSVLQKMQVKTYCRICGQLRKAA